jgi:hypothetical protein
MHRHALKCRNRRVDWWRRANGGDAVHTFDYVAIGVLMALTLWAGALLYLRGKK